MLFRSKSDDNQIRDMGMWILSQHNDYSQNKLNDIIKQKWENFINDDKYKKYFMSAEEKFNINLQPKIQYIINYILLTYKIRMEKTIYEISNDNINLNKINNIITINNLLELGLYNKLDIFNFLEKDHTTFFCGLLS